MKKETTSTPNGKRCAVNSPHGRRLGRRAKYFYGAATAENRGKLAQRFHDGDLSLTRKGDHDLGK